MTARTSDSMFYPLTLRALQIILYDYDYDYDYDYNHQRIVTQVSK